MNIGICTGPLLPVPAVAGGSVHRMWHLLAKEFVRNGHQATIYARSWPGMDRVDILDGIHIRRWGGFDPGSTAMNLIRDAIYAARLSGQIQTHDVLITNDFFLPFLARSRSGLLVINANRFPKGQYRWYRKAALIAAASTAVASAIRQQVPGTKPRVAVLPNTFDPGPFSGPNEATPETILYAGRIHPEKGLDLLIESFTRLGRGQLTLLGPWRESQGGAGVEYRDALLEMTKGHAVDFVDPVFDVVVLGELFRKHAVFVYPSLNDSGESFGVAPLEAMAAGMKVVCSDLDCFLDYLKPGVNGTIFRHQDGLAGLASALELAMSEDGNLWLQSARKTAQEFSPAPVAAAWLAEIGAEPR